nr:AraC family transcriptional regulator [uncultured Merdimonas sp.]
MIKNDKIQESEEAIETVQRSIDHYLYTLQGSAAELMLNNQNLVLQSAPKSAFTDSSTYKYSELMRNIKIANALVQDVFIYYPSQDYVVGTKGSYPAKSYYLLSNQLSSEGYEEWKENVLEADAVDFFFVKGTDGGEQLNFRQQMPVGRKGESRSVLIISVYGREFVRLLDMTIPYDNSTSIAVFTEADELYQKGSESNLPGRGEIAPLFQDENPGMQKIENSTYVGWSADSEYGGIRYVVISDKEALISRIVPIRRLLLAGVIGCTVLGLLVSLYLGKKHQKTIEQTIRSLNEKVLWSLKESTLTDILDQKVEDPLAIQNLFQAGGIALDYMYYRILLIDISFEKNKKSVMEWMYFAGQELEREWDCVDVIPAIFEGKAVFLLNYDTCETDLTDELFRLFEEKCKKKVYSQRSEEFMSVNQIVSVYEQIIISQDRESRESLAAEEKAGELLFDRWEKDLTFREYGDAADLTDELFETYVESSEDPYIQRGRRYAVINEVLRCAMAEEKKHQNPLYSETLVKLKRCTGLEETSKCVKEVLLRIEKINSQYTSGQKDYLTARIKKIIEENYDQHYLGLCYISEQVNVSSSYVSKVFKEEYGMGVVEYMNRLRIDSAKKIMATEDLTIKEIAEKVGFTSDIHFIRIFKKYENTTPGVYRRQKK